MTRIRPLSLAFALVALAGSLPGCDSGGPSAFSETSYTPGGAAAAPTAAANGPAGKKAKRTASPKSFQRPD